MGLSIAKPCERFVNEADHTLGKALSISLIIVIKVRAALNATIL